MRRGFALHEEQMHTGKEGMRIIVIIFVTQGMLNQVWLC